MESLFRIFTVLTSAQKGYCIFRISAKHIGGVLMSIWPGAS